MLLGKTNQHVKAIVQIEPQNQYEYKLLGAKAKDGRFIRFHLEPNDLSVITGYRLIVENIKTDKGRYADTIYLTTNRNDLPMISIPVFGLVR